jgi:hypothetical protein
MHTNYTSSFPIWLARISVGAVFVMNVSCALDFILRPECYAAGFEVSGVVGETIVAGFGILFLMWNATYPPVILNPAGHKTLFGVILLQQTIGVVGESWLALQLPAGHAALQATGLRFIVFDGLGLVLMSAAYLLLFLIRPSQGQTD